MGLLPYLLWAEKGDLSATHGGLPHKAAPLRLCLTSCALGQASDSPARLFTRSLFHLLNSRTDATTYSPVNEKKIRKGFLFLLPRRRYDYHLSAVVVAPAVCIVTAKRAYPPLLDGDGHISVLVNRNTNGLRGYDVYLFIDRLIYYLF